MRPRGMPPTPSARSRAIEPVGIVSIAASGRSPRRMIDPLPYCLSIWLRAMSSARCLSPSAINVSYYRCRDNSTGVLLVKREDPQRRAAEDLVEPVLLFQLLASEAQCVGVALPTRDRGVIAAPHHSARS